MISKVKKDFIVLLALLICLALSACTKEVREDGEKGFTQAHYTDPDALYKVAWQYVVKQLDSKEGFLINGAVISRLELVETRDGINDLPVSIYSLEYSFFVEQESGAYPGSTYMGSSYLFIQNIDGAPQVIGVKYTKEILAAGGYSEAAIEIAASNENLNFSKQSTASSSFSTEEIGSAIQAAENYYSNSDEDVMLIDTWFDEDRYQEQYEECLENVLYGINDAAARGDLIVLFSDLYSFDPRYGSLSTNWKTILPRDSSDSVWRVVDMGY